MKKFYAVKKGRKPGIYRTWPECQKQVSGYPNARFKGFTTLRDAKSWLNDHRQSPVAKKNTGTGSYSPDVIQVYTDGGSRNHGNKLGQHVKSNDKAAWAYLIQYCDQSYTDTDGEFGATNNKMEILALIKALLRLIDLKLQMKSIIVTLDSHYVLDPLTKGWLKNWQLRGWQTAGGKPVANQELWQQLIKLLPDFADLHFEWTKGHATNFGNNQVDELLNQTMDHM